jgi:WD40 repeat protein
MTTRRYRVALLAAMILPHTALAWPVPLPTRMDSAGDPLPPGAIARIGSLRLRHASPADPVAFSPDGKWLASYCRWEKQISVWETLSGKLRMQLHLAGVAKMTFAPDGNTLAVIVAPGTFTPEILVESWNLHSGQRTFRLADEDRYVGEGVLVFSPDGTQLYFGRSALRRVDLARRRIDLRLPVGQAEETITAVAVTPDNRTLVTAEGDGAVRIRDARTGAVRCQMQGTTFSGLAISPDGKILTLATPGGLEIWPIPPPARQQPGIGTGKRRLLHEGSPVNTLTISTDNKRLLSVTEDGGVTLWDLITGKQLSHFLLPASKHFAANFNTPQRPLVLTADPSSGGLRLWDVAGKRELFPERNLGGQLTCMTFSPDGKVLVTGHEDRRLRFWQAPTGKPLGQLRLPECPCQADFRPDGRTLIIGGNGHWWRVSLAKPFGLSVMPLEETAASSPWQKGRLRRGKPLPWRQHRLDQKTVTPDGLLLDLEAGALQVVEVATEKMLLQRGGFAAALGPGRNVIAVLQNETDVILADLTTGVEVDRWDVPREQMVPGQPWLRPHLAFAPDGRVVAVGTPRGSILFCNLDSKNAPTFAAEFKRVRGTMVSVVRPKTAQLTVLLAQEAPVTMLAFAPDSRTLACAYRNGTVLLWDVSAQTARLPLTDTPPESSWEELLTGEPPVAWSAHWALVSSTKTMAFVRQKLGPVRLPNLGPLPHLVRELDSPRFTVRDRAMKAIADLGPAAEPALREARKRASSLEAQRRLEQLLSRVEAIRNRQQQEVRAIAVLEQINSDDAREVLRNLAGGDPQAPLTLAARAAQKRMAKGK